MNVPRCHSSRLVALALALAVTPLAGSIPPQDDEEEPEAPQAAQQRFEIADANFEMWVFQGHRMVQTSDGGRDWFETRLTLQIDEVDRICHLDDAQKAKLRLAGRGDVKRFHDLLEEKRKKFKLVKQDRTKINEIFQEIQPLQAILNAGAFGRRSFFAKTLKTTLTAEQIARHDEVVEQRLRFQYRVKIELLVAMLDANVGLTAEQRRRFVETVAAETKPPSGVPGRGAYWLYYVLYQASQVPEDKLRPIFDAPQWRIVSQQINQAKGYEHMLKQVGFLVETPEEKAKGKTAEIKKE